MRRRRDPDHPRLRREQRTLEAMVELYCRGTHPDPGRCEECAELQAYARARVANCPFQEDKPPCAGCPIHCYQPARRDQVKMVMRYAGPRMAWRHPIFALWHWLDKLRPTPEDPRQRPGGSGPMAKSATGGEDPPP